ncbi:MAG: sodium-dependent transporter, partial [Burkholderiales bacterium]
AVRARYDAFLASPLRMLAYHAAFMIAVVAVVSRGIREGVEKAAKILMPVLMVLMAGLALFSMIEGDAARTLRFLFVPDFSKLSLRGVLDALGLGFFSIGIGLGLMITYAGYSGANVDLKRVAIWSIIADTAISLIAGLAVFPMVFANGLDPAGGPGLVFVSLPLAFSHVPFANFAGVAFFALLFVAALSSAISLLEASVAVLVHRSGWGRKSLALAIGTACFVVGIASVLSFNLWSSWYPLAAFDIFARATWYDLIDHLTSNVLLPLGGLAIATFVGWAASERLLREELALNRTWANVLRFLLRYIAPAAIVLATFAPLLG